MGNPSWGAGNFAGIQTGRKQGGLVGGIVGAGVGGLLTASGVWLWNKYSEHARVPAAATEVATDKPPQARENASDTKKDDSDRDTSTSGETNHKPFSD